MAVGEKPKKFELGEFYCIQNVGQFSKYLSMKFFKSLLRIKHLKILHGATRNYSQLKPALILGIETSCDDTGCAIISTEGEILGEALNSQHLIHLRNGGIIPPVAQNLHRQNIENVVDEALKAAKLSVEDVDAIATTVKPGLPLSLLIGTKYGKHLCRKYSKPFIPIHHMEAHALTARMHNQALKFPFLVLLISGGHCLLAIARAVNDFLLLGESLDDAPGEAFDKMARRLKLKNIPEFAQMSGGQAIELAASRATDPQKYKFTIPLQQYRDCNFSLAGMKNQFKRQIIFEERDCDVPPDGVIPGVYDICASFQLILTRHICHRVQRAMEFINIKEMLQDQKCLVVSGGVACNNFIARGLKIVCDHYEYELIRPPPKLCTDNGVMIAWNGVEKWKSNIDVFTDFNHIDIEKSCPLGVNVTKEVADMDLKCKWVKLSSLLRS